MPFDKDLKGETQETDLSYKETNTELYGKKLNAIPVPERNIGIDTKQEFYDNILEAAEVSKLDLAKIESFSQISQNRNLVYNVLDTMCEDSTISAVIETYAEDATETNEDGRIVWVESDDSEVLKYVTYLLDSLNVDKHIYHWMHTLVKYGDCYLRLFKESDYDMPLFINPEKDKNKGDKDNRQDLKEAVNIKLYKENDKFAHYIEMVPNPAEIFELTRFGKCYAYIEAPTTLWSSQTESGDLMFNHQYVYSFQNKDVNIYDATEFVHAALQDNTSRVPEKVNLFIDTDRKYDTDAASNGQAQTSISFNVNRGQSLLYNTFKIWRNLTLLENSLMLNRLSRSSLVRIMNVEVGDMPKENVGPHLLRIKQLIEQKTAINQNTSMSEYTNPGPIENTVYVPTHNGIGTLSATDVGGEINPGSLSDIDYFQNKMFGSLKVPKQFFANTDDGAGFNGGQSLALISSRYAKTVVRLQNTMIQALTDAINILLIDKELDSYINRFELHMVKPTTQEEKDRQENKVNQIGIIRDVMDLLGDVQNEKTKLEILNILISSVINNSEITNLLEQEIKRIEEENPDLSSDDDLGDAFDGPSSGSGGGDFIDFGDDINIDTGSDTTDTGADIDIPDTTADTDAETVSELPTPGDLGLDFTQNTEF